MKTMLLYLGMTIWLLSTAVHAQDANVTKALDEGLARYAKLYNEHQAQALAMEYSEKINVIYTDGIQIRSRREMQASFEDFFTKNPNVTTTFSDVKRQMLTPDLVVEDGRWEEFGHTEKGLPTQGLYSSIIQRIDGKWLIIHDRAWAAAK